jgi:1,4-alpha-glucan branching enzyme
VKKGYVALVLHAHLPFVRHPESSKYLEERWLYEAITESYIPLLQMFERLLRDGVDFRLTMSLTPTLLSMLSDGLLLERYRQHLTLLIRLAEQEVIRTGNQPEWNRLAHFYHERFLLTREFFDDCNGNLIAAFREVEQTGKLEIITSAATHAFLPLVNREQAIRAQIETAVQLHQSMLGRAPKGIWLPECGYKPEIDRILHEYGLEYFFVDTHAFETAVPRPIFGGYAPVLTPHGVAAFVRDPECSKQVWSSIEGYPGDPDYREYYRDIGYDLDLEYIAPYIHPDRIRVHTGIKYHRITGKTDQKELYHPERAREKAALHAAHFVENREKQVSYWQEHMGRKPVIVAPYDAELFGHWWFEGPLWLEQVFRRLQESPALQAVTPREYLKEYPEQQVCRLPESSWGRGGYADVWLNGKNDWIYRALHKAEERMCHLADRFAGTATDFEVRALNQAARELMLAQSSDFAFIMDNQTMVDYAVRRTKIHINRFTRLYESLMAGNVDREWLDEVERRDNLFPALDYRVYCTGRNDERLNSPGQQRGPRVLMLAWEFPPLTVGGLSRAVHGLSRHLAARKWEVHVVTFRPEGTREYERVDGVHVHRVDVLQPDGDEFIHWAFSLNLAILDRCEQLYERGMRFDLIHAHDWMVTYAAKTLKEKYQWPLVATIHATEHGRNQGIHTELQRYIHHMEWRLTYEAWRVIVCSPYMEREVRTIFSLPPDKIDILPNGIEPHLLEPQGDSSALRERYARPEEQIVFFIGRMVQEKGVHLLLQAVPEILRTCPQAKFVIAGKGPMLSRWQNEVRANGFADKVLFAGFVDDETRNHLFRLADACVFPSLYEPFGIVALEAMAAGVPVVVADVGGLSDIVVHGEDGCKMLPGDPHSLAVQVIRLLQDPRFAAQVVDRARQKIEQHYRWDTIAVQTIGVYERILSERALQMAKEEVAPHQEGL